MHIKKNVDRILPLWHKGFVEGNGSEAKSERNPEMTGKTITSEDVFNETESDIMECFDQYIQRTTSDLKIFKAFKAASPILMAGLPTEEQTIIEIEKQRLRDREKARERKHLIKKCKRRIYESGFVDTLVYKAEIKQIDFIAEQIADELLEKKRTRPNKILDITRRWLTVDGVEYYEEPRSYANWKKVGNKCSLHYTYQQHYDMLYRKAKTKKLDLDYLKNLDEWAKDEKLTADQVQLLKSFAIQYKTAKVSCMDELGFLSHCFYSFGC